MAAGTPLYCEKSRFAPILAKYKLNAFAISLKFDRVRPLGTKLGGKSHFFLFRLRVSLIVSHLTNYIAICIKIRWQEVI